MNDNNLVGQRRVDLIREVLAIETELIIASLASEALQPQHFIVIGRYRELAAEVGFDAWPVDAALQKASITLFQQLADLLETTAPMFQYLDARTSKAMDGLLASASRRLATAKQDQS